MKNRLSRIIKPKTGHTVMLAVDHGYFQGPTTRLENPRKTITPLLPYADTLMLTRGVLRTSVDATNDVPVVLRVSGGTSMAGRPLSDEGLTTSMEEAVRLNVAGVALSIFVGTEHEKQTLLSLSQLVNKGEELGIPVLAVTAVGRAMQEKKEPRYLGLASRIAAELGCHIVKTYYCDNFEKVVDGCPVPIVIAGGKKLNTAMDAFEMTKGAIDAGAVGVDMGRNIWQHDYPVPMIKSVKAIVHKSYTPREAQNLFDKEVKRISKATGKRKKASKARKGKGRKRSKSRKRK
jgi:putative autoinducer-2 (AI-2) aldolase